MTDVQHRPAYLLHALVAHLDTAAETIVRESHGLSYSRFLVLLALERGEPATQRELAERLGVSDPAASKVVGALAGEGLVDVERVAGGGNRRQVRLSPRGREVVLEGSDVLESAFARLMAAADVAPRELAAMTSRLLAVLVPEPDGPVS